MREDSALKSIVCNENFMAERGAAQATWKAEEAARKEAEAVALLIYSGEGLFSIGVRRCVRCS